MRLLLLVYVCSEWWGVSGVEAVPPFLLSGCELTRAARVPRSSTSTSNIQDKTSHQMAGAMSQRQGTSCYYVTACYRDSNKKSSKESYKESYKKTSRSGLYVRR